MSNPLKIGGVTLSWLHRQALKTMPVGDVSYNISCVNWDAPILIIWVPGTSEKGVRAEFITEAERIWGKKAHIVSVDYDSSWDLVNSYTRGKKAVEDVFDLLKQRKKPGQRVFVVAESQGSWITSDLLVSGKYDSIIDKTVLLGHPVFASKHYHDRAKHPNVLEVTNPFDPVHLRWRGSQAELISLVSRIMGEADLSAIPSLLRAAIVNPLNTVLLGVANLHSVPIVGKFVPSPHDYRDVLNLVAVWLEREDGLK